MSLREDVLRELFTEYQLKKDEVTFSKILKRVDRLLLSTIHKHVRYRPHLEKIDLRDLYHSAIVGLGRAILTAKDNETGNKLIARIVAYVKCTLNVTYPLNKTHRFFTFLPLEPALDFYKPKGRELITKEEVELRATLSMMRDEYAIMVDCGYVSGDDMRIIMLRFGENKLYKEIAAEIGTTEQNIRRRALRIIKRVCKWFEGFEV